MATLKLQQKKSFSEQNMRKIINLIIGLQSSVSEASAQCLRDYIDDGSRTYSKGEICIFDGYVWECKSVTTGAFNPNSWVKLSDEFTQLEKSDIEAMLNLSSEQLSTLSSILLDTEVRLDKGWSSSCIYSKLQQCLDDSKTYTLKEISKLSGASYKVVASTSEMTSESIIYLLPNATNYDMYIVEADGTASRIGNMDIDLSQYAKIDEIEADYLKKTDADGKYATITTVDGKVDKTNILTTNSSSATDDQVYSAKTINTELDGVVKKVDISTTIDSTSTNDTVPTNKSVWDSLYKICDTQVLVDVNNPTSKICMADLTTLNTPSKEGITSAESSLIISIEGRDYWNGQISITMAEPEVYVRSVREVGTWTKWRKLCSSSVADVPVTNITSNLVSTKVALDNSDSYATYYVKSGTCYVTIWSLRLIEACSVETIFNGLPKSTIGVTCPLCNGVESFAQVFMSPNSGVIAFNANASLVNKSGYCSFSYPVAES